MCQVQKTVTQQLQLDPMLQANRPPTLRKVPNLLLLTCSFGHRSGRCSVGDGDLEPRRGWFLSRQSSRVAAFTSEPFRGRESPFSEEEASTTPCGWG